MSEKGHDQDATKTFRKRESFKIILFIFQNDQFEAGSINAGTLFPQKIEAKKGRQVITLFHCPCREPISRDMLFLYILKTSIITSSSPSRGFYSNLAVFFTDLK